MDFERRSKTRYSRKKKKRTQLPLAVTSSVKVTITIAIHNVPCLDWGFFVMRPPGALIKRCDLGRQFLPFTFVTLWGPGERISWNLSCSWSSDPRWIPIGVDFKAIPTGMLEFPSSNTSQRNRASLWLRRGSFWYGRHPHSKVAITSLSATRLWATSMTMTVRTLLMAAATSRAQWRGRRD